MSALHRLETLNRSRVFVLRRQLIRVVRGAGSCKEFLNEDAFANMVPIVSGQE